MTLQGNTRDFPLGVLLRLLGDTAKTGELTLRGPAGEGALGLAGGKVVTAVFGDEKPIPALGAVFALAEAEFESKGSLVTSMPCAPVDFKVARTSTEEVPAIGMVMPSSRACS